MFDENQLLWIEDFERSASLLVLQRFNLVVPNLYKTNFTQIWDQSVKIRRGKIMHIKEIHPNSDCSQMNLILQSALNQR